MSSRVFRFGNFELDGAQRELRRSGRRIDLQPRVFDLLLHLASHRDRAIGKDELQDAVWPGMVVTEAALTRAVMKARKAVGDDASRQEIIRTVHGHGYHFIATVEVVESGSADVPPRSADVPDVRWPKGRRAWVVLSAILIVFVALAGLWLAVSPEEELSELRVAVLPLTDRTGDTERAWARLGLMSLASEGLSAEGSIPVVADGSVAGLASSLGWDGDFSDLPDSDLVERLHSVYGATHILAMELVAEGPMLRMNYSLLDHGGGVRRATMVGRDGIELTHGVIQGVYGQLLGRSRLTANDTLISADPFNNEAFARGMGLSLEGRCPEAVRFFRLIVEQEPGLFAPRLELAACLRIMGEPDEAEPILEELVAEQTGLGNPAGLGQALMVLGVLQNRTGRLDEAEHSYTQALQAAIAAGDADLEARVNHNLAILAKNRGDMETSLTYLDRAAEGYRRAGREVMPGHLWSGYANVRMETGKLAEAGDYLEKALAAFRATGDRRNEAMMLNNTGYLLRLQGRLEEAETYHLQSLAIRREIGDRVGVGRIHSMLAVVYSARGEYEQARQSASSALTIARETRDSLFEGTSLAQLAGAERGLGLTGQARDHYRQAIEVLGVVDSPMRVIQVELKLAEMDLEEGRAEVAAESAAGALQRARSGAYLQPEVEALVLLGDVAVAMQDPEQAATHYSAALQRVREGNLQANEGSVLVKLADLYMDQGRIEECQTLVGALSLLEPSVPALKVRARHAWLSGDPVRAVETMEEARDLAGREWGDRDEALLATYAAAPATGNGRAD